MKDMTEQRWAQNSKTRFNTYEEALAHKGTLSGQVKIRRRKVGFDVITYKEVVVVKPEESDK